MASRRHWQFATLAAAAALLTACGGGSGITGAQDAPVAKRVVIFGDSLSDLGTYVVATSINGPGTGAPFFGGKFTTNTHTGYTAASNSSTANTWGEWIAARVGVSITPAEIGFATTRIPCPFGVAIGVNSCTGYAQGGSRVTDPNGIGRTSGALTIPVVAQIASHNTRTLTGFKTGFDGGDIVFVWAGHNDAFIQLGAVAAAAITPAAAIANMQTAATALANLVKNEILAKGATRVAVLNLVDISSTPGYSGLPTANKALLTQLTAEFNTKLVADLAGTAARIIDARALLAQAIASPAAFGFTNTTTAACDRAKIAVITGGAETGGSSLFCNAVAGAAFNGIKATANASTYMFADDVHPTAAGHKVFADQVFPLLKTFGWIPNNL